MDQDQFVRVEDRDSVRWLTLHNPRHKNAVPRAGWEDMAAAIDAFAASEQRVLVVRGSGRDFCSGAELDPGGLDGLDSPAEGRRRMQAPGRVALALHRLPKPTIAAVDGDAVGAGMSLAVGCDIVVVTGRARLAMAYAERGLTLDLGGTWLLPRLVGMALARDLALSGRVVVGEEAVKIGLASRLVEPEELEASVAELAAELASGAPTAQRFIKTALARSLDMSFEQALAFEQQAQATLLASGGAHEGLAAFAEKRLPDFDG